MFSKLYLKKSPKSFFDKKFLPVETLILPLKINMDYVFKDGQTDWLIEEIVGSDTIYFHHLVPHEDNRVNLRHRRSKEKYLEANIPEPKLKTLFHCKPQNPASSLERLLIGLHENFVVSLMAMPKVGNSLKLCRSLSGKEELDLKKSHNTLSANDLSFGFAPKAGADPRARASLVVRCDNDQDLVRIESFLQSIDKIFPYNQDLINLVTRLFGYSKESLPHAKEKDELLKQRKSLVIPQSIISAQYSPKIQQELGRINQEIQAVEEKSAWKNNFNFPKKNKLNLFSGFPNGIPDLQRQKQIITYYPPSINHFPERIPEVHLAILSDDLASLQKIISDNPCAIYERDFYGKLPIELTFDIMQPEMGAMLYDTWVNLPKSEQWATQVFINTANRLSTLEFKYGYVLDDELKAQYIKDYFEPLLPKLDNPLAIYKALFFDNSKLEKLVQQETEQWKLLKKLCIQNRTEEAKMVFAQMLPEKQAVFASALTGSWQAIKEAINDYIPDVAALDRAISNGDKQAISQFRKEPVLSSWNALQEAIDEAAGVCEINEKIEKIIQDINALEEPLTADKSLLEEMNNQLWQLHEEKLKQLSAYEKVRKTITSSQWELKRELSDGLAYLEWLKKRIREATEAKENHESLEISLQLIHNELELFKAIHTAMHTGCDEQLEELIQSEFNNSTGRLPALRYKKSDAKQKDLMPKHFDLYMVLFKNELSAAIDYIETHLRQKEKATAYLGSIEEARAYFHSKTPKRPALHHQIIKGEIPDISACVNEKSQFETYKKSIQSIFYEQCQQLKIVINSINPIDISLVKKIPDGPYVTHSLVSILIYYANELVINSEEMQLTQSKFDKAFSSYTNSDSEKSVLLEMWQKIAAIKLAGIEQLKQCTEDYKKLSSCQDHDAFEVYTLTLIFQQASICYHQVFNIERPQQFVLALTYLIERTIEGKSWNQKAKFIALKHCCHVGGYFDRLLDSIIKSNLLSYESQDPWGYTPLLLAAVNNHVDLVTLFFDNELESSWIMPLARGDFLYYTLLSHAISREMAGLLLRRYTDPNTTFAFQVGLERKLPVLLMYHHELTDTHGQSLLDYIASGHPYDLSHLNAILMESMEKNTAVQEGPYDESMPKAVQLAFTRHNEGLLKKVKRLESKPKIERIGTFFPSSDIKTTFKMNVEDKFEAYFSVLKKTTQLSLSEKEQLAILFAADFKHPKDSKSTNAAIDFFKEKVLSNKNYIFELYYQEGKTEAIGFFCFLTKLESHPEFGTSLFVYLSLAGCAPEFADKGLLSASFKVVLALKQCSEDLGVPLKCYGRFGRPGIAYLMLPSEAISYPKYHFKKEYIQYVAALFGNLIEENGSSIPPVYSKATVTSLNNRLYEFEYLLNEVLKADEKASLPVTFTVDEKLAQSWHQKLTESTGITQHQVHSFYKQIKPWIIDDAMIKTNPLNTI